MNPFVDFDKVNAKELAELAKAMHAQDQSRLAWDMLEPLAKEFMEFAGAAVEAIRRRFVEKDMELKIAYDPKEDVERFLRDAWDVQSNIWALIETPQTYYLTMMTLLEKLIPPPDNHIRLVSLGSGSGLYETFLGRYFDRKGIGGMITCFDFSSGMTATHDFVLSLQPSRPYNVAPKTADMANIPLPDKSADAVLCNNSLQWCLNWRKAIAEMARILDPERGPVLYLFVHLHRQPMHIFTSEGERPVDLEPILVSQIMDELERNKFTIVQSRQLRSSRGRGQCGATLDRVFLKAEFTPEGLKHSWKAAKRTITGGQFLRVKR